MADIEQPGDTGTVAGAGSRHAVVETSLGG